MQAGDTAVYADHYLLTRECLKAGTVTPSVLEPLSTKVSDIDFDNWHNARHYEAKNHCDRPTGISHQDAFTAALRYHRERIAESWNSLAHGDIAHVVKILGRALHVQQDFFSHSNFVDAAFDAHRGSVLACWTRYATPEGGRARAANEAAIATDSSCILSPEPWVAALKITGFDPKAKDPSAPLNDDYPHRLYAKDNPRYSAEAQAKLADGRTKYEAARSFALDTCIATIRDFRRICLADQGCRAHASKFFGDQ